MDRHYEGKYSLFAILRMTQKLLILPALRTIIFKTYIYPQQNNQLIFETRLRCITAFI